MQALRGGGFSPIIIETWVCVLAIRGGFKIRRLKNLLFKFNGLVLCVDWIVALNKSVKAGAKSRIENPTQRILLGNHVEGDNGFPSSTFLPTKSGGVRFGLIFRQA